jgi:protoporphyrinogen oxidase
VQTSTAVDEVGIELGRVTGVTVAGKHHTFDAVICTVPTPYVSRMVPNLPVELRRRYDAIKNIGVVCVVLKLGRSVSPHFWINVSDPLMDLPGFVEFSNLRPMRDTIVYLPYYMPVTHPNFARDDETFVNEAFGYLRRVNPALEERDLLDWRIGRLQHAQPICPPGFQSMIPPVQTPIEGLQIADTCFYYPEDRGISESVRLGRKMAEAI